MGYIPPNDCPFTSELANALRCARLLRLGLVAVVVVDWK
jgi:hypothetical protein